MFKLLVYGLNKIMASLVFKTAEAGGRLASRYGWHQPKVPERLCK